MTIISVQNISKIFRDKTQNQPVAALSDISLQIEEGSFVALAVLRVPAKPHF